MSESEIHHEQRTGDICWHCDCELVLVPTGQGFDAYLECDCGVVGCVATRDPQCLVSPAA